MASFTAPALAVEAGKEAELSAAGEVPHPGAWSPEQPVLYTPRVDLLADGRLADQREEQFGFWRIESEEGKVWLNGKTRR